MISFALNVREHANKGTFNHVTTIEHNRSNLDFHFQAEKENLYNRRNIIARVSRFLLQPSNKTKNIPSKAFTLPSR